MSEGMKKAIKTAKSAKTDNKLAELESKLNELTDQLQRERADAMNVRRRAEEEKIALGSFYKSLVVKELLPVIDNLDRALKHAPTELEANDYVRGVQGVVKQFDQVMEKLGVQRIKTVGEKFDPNLHEAVSHEEGDGEEVVSEELQSGYTLNDQIIRPAMVKVRG